MTDKRICLNRSVLDFMNARIDAESRVLEFGAGWSTRWFAERCGYLMSVETSRHWALKVREDLAGLHANWDLVLLEHPDKQLPGFGNWLVNVPGYDLALIDCVEPLREQCTHIAWSLLRPGGWLVFDDAQRDMHTPMVKTMNTVARPVRLAWNEQHDIPEARERVALAWPKSA